MSRRTKRRNKRRNSRTRRRRLQRGGTQDKCLFVNLAAGLGNQLYMYAAALTVSKKTALPICVPPYTNKHSQTRYSNLLSVTQVEDTPEIKARIAAATPVFPKRKEFYSGWADSEIDMTPSKDKILPEGYYQNFKSMSSVIPEIKEVLTKNEFSKDKYKAYKANPTAAFMHVRRGDYAQEGWLNPEEYYVNALKEMSKSQTVTRIYVLSDDLAWCKQQEEKWKDAAKPKSLECKDIPDELEALFFMSQCTAGAILSSSTFSTWGTYLGAHSNPSSTIIYPKTNPIAPKVPNPYEFPPNWIAL